MKREEVRQNRIGWAKFLQQPERKKFKDKLENTRVPEERCCIGHGCAYMHIPRTIREGELQAVIYDGSTGVAPASFISALGLNEPTGNTMSGPYLKGTKSYALVELNDETDATPQDIGKIMEEYWIEGGPGTPFIPLTDYKE